MTPICIGETVTKFREYTKDTQTFENAVKTIVKFIDRKDINVEKVNEQDVELMLELKEHGRDAHVPELLSLACAIRKGAQVFRSEDKAILRDHFRSVVKREYSIKIKSLKKH